MINEKFFYDNQILKLNDNLHPSLYSFQLPLLCVQTRNAAKSLSEASQLRLAEITIREELEFLDSKNSSSSFVGSNFFKITLCGTLCQSAPSSRQQEVIPAPKPP